MVKHFHLTPVFTSKLSLALFPDYNASEPIFFFPVWPALFLFQSFLPYVLHPFAVSSHFLPVIFCIFRRFFWDLRSAVWLQWNWLQRRSTVGEDTVQKLFCLFDIVLPSFVESGKTFNHVYITVPYLSPPDRWQVSSAFVLCFRNHKKMLTWISEWTKFDC